jgi:hypothetical protein
MNLFYKIHLQAFNVISIVLYHSGPMFGQVLYSCLDAFVVDAFDYSGHLIRHLLNASEVFPMEWFLQFWEQVNVWWAEPTRLWLHWFETPGSIYPTTESNIAKDNFFEFDRAKWLFTTHVNTSELLEVHLITSIHLFHHHQGLVFTYTALLKVCREHCQ